MFSDKSKEISQRDRETLLNQTNPPKKQESEQYKLFKLEKQVQSSANWFYWIAGLSIINSIIFLSGSNWSFIIGLGATQLVDGVVTGIAEEVGTPEGFKYLAFGIDIIIAGIYVLIGFFANKRYKAAFIVGMIFYTLDGLIFLLVKDILSIGFHIFVLFCIFNGFKGLNELEKLQLAPQQDNLATGDSF